MLRHRVGSSIQAVLFHRSPAARVFQGVQHTCSQRFRSAVIASSSASSSPSSPDSSDSVTNKLLRQALQELQQVRGDVARIGGDVARIGGGVARIENSVGAVAELTMRTYMRQHTDDRSYSKAHLLIGAGSLVNFFSNTPLRSMVTDLDTAIVDTALAESTVLRTCALVMDKLAALEVRGAAQQAQSIRAFKSSPPAVDWGEVSKALIQACAEVGKLDTAAKASRVYADAARAAAADAEEADAEEAQAALQAAEQAEATAQQLMQKLTPVSMAARALRTLTQKLRHGKAAGEAYLRNEHTSINPCLLLLATAASGFKELGPLELELDMAGSLRVSVDGGSMDVEAVEAKVASNGDLQVALRARVIASIAALLLGRQLRIIPPPADPFADASGEDTPQGDTQESGLVPAVGSGSSSTPGPVVHAHLTGVVYLVNPTQKQERDAEGLVHQGMHVLGRSVVKGVEVLRVRIGHEAYSGI